ncbi:sensor histidine kinase [Roseospira goensis]|uniref:histidine kinase n=1 Tax=Roseospira goensis TaxID=391922 RepID=A0A7W6RXQ5_9PROT|nr:ATP-binding protein [Roseospira goensis]MBB4285158.1 PAS domain S-box-containing protein [Roseospira goensis]
MTVSSLALQQTVRVVAVSVLAAALFLVGQGAWQIREADRDFAEQRALTAASLRAGLSEALWHFDANTARSILSGTLASRPLIRIDVRDPDGTLFAQAEVQGTETQARSTGPLHRFLAGLLALERVQVLHLDETDLGSPVRWSGPLGQVRLVYDHGAVVAGIADRLTNQSLGLLFIVLVVAAATSLVMHGFISRHVVATAQRVDAIDPDCPGAQPLPIPAVHRRNELGRLLRRLNGLLTRLAAAQRALEANEHKYRTIVEKTPVAMVVNEPTSGALTEVNEAACALFGYDRASLLTMSMNDIWGATPQVLTEARQLVLERRARRFIMPFRARSGALRDAEVFASAFPLNGQDYLFSVIIDVTERRRTERDRDQALQMALSSKKAQADFLASMSHELRTPLNAILGFAEVIKDEMLGPAGVPQYGDYATDIHSSGSHLLSLINDILDLSRVETGHAPLEPVHLDLREEIGKAVNMIKQRLRDKTLRLTVDVRTDAGDLIADQRAVRQMLINLLSNAAKFTPPGGAVTITGWRESDGTVKVAVADTGVGIAPADHRRIFQAFRQAINNQTREIEGSGLGLALVHSLIERHGGRIELDSDLGRGATFTLVFPPVLRAGEDHRDPDSAAFVDGGHAQRVA